MAIHQFLSKKNPDTALAAGQAQQLRCQDFFILKNPDIGKFRQDLDALVLGFPSPQNSLLLAQLV